MDVEIVAFMRDVLERSEGLRLQPCVLDAGVGARCIVCRMRGFLGQVKGLVSVATEWKRSNAMGVGI